MPWTKKPPTEPGDYWLYHEENNARYTRIVEVRNHLDGLQRRVTQVVFHGKAEPVNIKSINNAKWFGPITPEMCGA